VGSPGEWADPGESDPYDGVPIDIRSDIRSDISSLVEPDEDLPEGGESGHSPEPPTPLQEAV